jgi:hypothetical protein
VGQVSLPIAVVPHPVGDRDEALVAERGRAVAAECARLLATPIDELEREFKDKQYPLTSALMPR